MSRPDDIGPWGFDPPDVRPGYCPECGRHVADGVEHADDCPEHPDNAHHEREPLPFHPDDLEF